MKTKRRRTDKNHNSAIIGKEMKGNGSLSANITLEATLGKCDMENIQIVYKITIVITH